MQVFFLEKIGQCLKVKDSFNCFWRVLELVTTFMEAAALVYVHAVDVSLQVSILDLDHSTQDNYVSMETFQRQSDTEVMRIKFVVKVSEGIQVLCHFIILGITQMLCSQVVCAEMRHLSFISIFLPHLMHLIACHTRMTF